MDFLWQKLLQSSSKNISVSNICVWVEIVFVNVLHRNWFKFYFQYIHNDDPIPYMPRTSKLSDSFMSSKMNALSIFAIDILHRVWWYIHYILVYVADLVLTCTIQHQIIHCTHQFHSVYPPIQGRRHSYNHSENRYTSLSFDTGSWSIRQYLFERDMLNHMHVDHLRCSFSDQSHIWYPFTPGGPFNNMV